MKKKVYLIGATGMLGQDMVKKSPVGHTVIEAPLTVDITKPDLVEKAIKKIKPDVVVNTAAYNDVDKAQGDERDMAFDINANGPNHIAQVCESLKIPFIHFSTDYVFSGRKKAYSEEDHPKPMGGYGESKLAGEEFVRKIPKHYIIRVTTLYGTGRMNHALRALEAVLGKGRARAANDLICSPSYTGDLAVWVHTLIEKEPKFGTYHLAHKNVCTRYAFAEKLCELLNADKPYPVDSIELANLNLAAPRPLQVELSVAKWEKRVCPLNGWEEGLKHFLSDMKIPIS